MTIKANKFTIEQEIELPELEELLVKKVNIRNRKWTKKEELALAKYYPNPKLLNKDIARAMGRSMDSITAKAAKMNLVKGTL